MWLLLFLGLPMLLALALWRAERGAIARKIALVEARGAEAVELRVRVADGSGEQVRIGSSVESPESISATPTLTSDEVVLVEELDETAGAPPDRARPGRRLRLAAGVSLEIELLPGARRKPLEIETTLSGIQHHYSFEIPQGMAFWISGELGPADPGGPFRAESTTALLPLRAEPAKGRCVASAVRGALRRKIDGAGMGLGGALFFAAVAAGLSFIPYAGPFLFGLAVLALMMIIFGEHSAGRGEPGAASITADTAAPAPAITAESVEAGPTPADAAETNVSRVRVASEVETSDVDAADHDGERTTGAK